MDTSVSHRKAECNSKTIGRGRCCLAFSGCSCRNAMMIDVLERYGTMHVNGIGFVAVFQSKHFQSLAAGDA